jgi:ABC-type glycerol-3-phosphate transport system substrate-binding protein
MQDKRDFARHDLNRRDVLKAAGAGLATSALPNVPARADERVELVLWSWLPNFQAQVDLFQAAHPRIKVKLVNAGQGNDEYTKLRAGLKAGRASRMSVTSSSNCPQLPAAQRPCRHRRVGESA